MSAHPKHIQKYTSNYQKLYPQTPLLVLTNSISDIIARSATYHARDLSPAMSIIQNTTQENPGSSVLLHIFSNGGTHHACQLAKLYRQKYATPLPVTGMILDSAPGRATYKRSIAAMSFGLPRFTLFRLVGLAFLHILCIGMWIRHHILRLENFMARTRRELNDSTLFPVQAKRAYLYSEGDAMVGWRDVEFSGKDAKEKGWDVRMEKFEGSKHVGHMVVDPGRDWGAVGEVVDGDGR
jgi:hypothetical protein